MLEYQTSGVTGRKEKLTHFFQVKKNGAVRIQLDANVTQVGGALTASVNYVYFLKVQDGLAESAVVGNELVGCGPHSLSMSGQEFRIRLLIITLIMILYFLLILIPAVEMSAHIFQLIPT